MTTEPDVRGTALERPGLLIAVLLVASEPGPVSETLGDVPERELVESLVHCPLLPAAALDLDVSERRRSATSLDREGVGLSFLGASAVHPAQVREVVDVSARAH